MRALTAGMRARFEDTSALLGVAALTFLIGGCASAAQSGAMVPQTMTVSGHSGSVSVEVTGGKETNPLWTSEISSADYRVALERAIDESAVFPEIVPSAEADYTLRVTLQKLAQDPVGFKMQVVLTSEWTLLARESSSVLWKDVLTTPYEATVGDAFVGVKRLRLANEGAARKNIETGLTELSKLTLR